jgi:hypothetical protein
LPTVHNYLDEILQLLHQAVKNLIQIPNYEGQKEKKTNSTLEDSITGSMVDGFKYKIYMFQLLVKYLDI